MDNDRYELILKELVIMKNQINDLVLRVETNLINKHQSNSDTIDNLIIAALGGVENDV